jgi:uncharacterized DUF497 family protein
VHPLFLGVHRSEAPRTSRILHGTTQDTRREYGEQRYVSIGELGDAPTVVLVVVHTRRGDKTRLISARRATRKERNAYHACLKATIEGTGGDA